MNTRSVMAGQKAPLRAIMVALLAAMMVASLVVLGLFSGGTAHASTTFTVNSTGDEGEPAASQGDGRCDWDASTTGRECTLRAAIQEANATSNSGGPDEIIFGIGGSGAQKTISPSSPLPPITDPITMDGYTQSGASPNTLAEGNNAVLNIRLDGEAIDQGSVVAGLDIETADSTIKGLVIRRFDYSYGIRITGTDATGNRVEGNFIGVNRNGTTAEPNVQTGVLIGSDSNTLGGAQPEMRNVISGNGSDGVQISGNVTGNKVEGNYIGTTADGDADLGNGGYGVGIYQGSENTVGGTAADAGNVISSNHNGGVLISGGDENRIEGNHIGTGADGRGDLGNDDDGVLIRTGADLTAVGGTPSGAGNRIAHNGGDGVAVEHNNFDTAAGNHILSNSIFGNGGLGIDLLGNTTDITTGVSGNDLDDTDAGPNNLQNFPVIRSITRNSAIPRTTTISGTLNSTPSTLTAPQDFVVECFLTDGAPASAHCEGSVLLDTVVTSTNANGNAHFSCVSSRPLLGRVPGQTVSATATNIITGDTSEFSKNRAIPTGP
jgi:CSLREA domain-containing protein